MTGRYGQVRIRTNGRHVTVRVMNRAFASDKPLVRLGLEDSGGNDREIAYFDPSDARELGRMLLEFATDTDTPPSTEGTGCE